VFLSSVRNRGAKKGRTQMQFFKKSKRFILNQDEEHEKKARQSRIIEKYFNYENSKQNKTMKKL